MGSKNRRKKKNNKTQSKLGFKDVITRFSDEDYTGALNLLKKIRTKPEEAGQIKQLKACLVNRFALDAMKSSAYKEALQSLEGNFQVQAKAGFPLPLDSTNILAGICLLYLGNHDDALQKFEQITSPVHPDVYFYQLLALIYTQKEKKEDFATFQKEHKASLTTLSVEKQQYIPIAWHISKGDFVYAAMLLEQLKTSDAATQSNIKALQAIITNTTFDTDKPDSVKTVYKAFLQLDTSLSERTYLDSFEAFEELIFSMDRAEDTFKLKDHLAVLCIEGRSLESAAFDYCFNQLRDNHKHYLVYNQIANLYNESEESLNKNIYQYLRKHMSLFLKVPEALILYMDITLCNPSKIRPESFWRNIYNFLEHFGSTLPVFKLDHIGWHIQLACESRGFLDDKKPHQIIKICEDYPRMIGIKIQLLLLQSLHPNMRVSDDLKDVFSQPHLQDNKRQILSALSLFFSGYLNELHFLDFDNRLCQQALNTIKNLQSKILYYLSIHPPAQNATVVLDIFRRIHFFLEDIDELYDINEFDNYNSYSDEIEDNYKIVLQFFSHLEDDPEFMNEYSQLFKVSPYLKLAKLIESGKSQEAIAGEMKNLVKTQPPQEILDFLVGGIQRHYHHFAFAGPLAYFFQYLCESKPEIAVQIASSYGGKYIDTEDLFYIHRDKFYVAIIERFVKLKQPIYHTMVFRFLEGLVLLMTKTIRPRNYNTAGKALVYMKMVIEKNPRFEFDKDLITVLIAFVERAVKVRKLKTLKKTLTQVKAFFKPLIV